MAYGPTSIGGYMALSPATKEDIGGVKIGKGINVAEDGTISINVSVDTVFPVGSIYLSKNDTSPAELFGGTWVKIANNRAIMGASNTHTAGSTVEAGLPNITGEIALNYATNQYVHAKTYVGAFKAGSENSTIVADEHNTSYKDKTLVFNASNSNAIYGASDTVQPAALYINIWERVADDSKDLSTTGSSDERADDGQGKDALGIIKKEE